MRCWCQLQTTAQETQSLEKSLYYPLHKPQNSPCSLQQPTVQMLRNALWKGFSGARERWRALLGSRVLAPAAALLGRSAGGREEWTVLGSFYCETWQKSTPLTVPVFAAL